MKKKKTPEFLPYFQTFPGPEHCWANFKTFSGIQDCANPSLNCLAHSAKQKHYARYYEHNEASESQEG